MRGLNLKHLSKILNVAKRLKYSLHFVPTYVPQADFSGYSKEHLLFDKLCILLSCVKEKWYNKPVFSDVL